jgi:uncharacterized membrane protein
MTKVTKTWLVPAGLLVLSVVPMLAGIARVVELGSGSAITAENARFFAAPVPVVLHIFSSLAYSVLGAFQFSPGLRRQGARWHRISGRLLVPIGLLAAFSGLWMTQFYPWAIENHDGFALYVIRLVVGFAMAASLWMGLAAIFLRDIGRHRRWMVRAYALGLGAGTQVFTHIPWFAFPEIRGELARELCMGAGWAINLAVAECYVLRERRKRSTCAAFSTCPPPSAGRCN